MQTIIKAAALHCKAFALVEKPTKSEVRAHLEYAHDLAQKVEAAKSVQGFMSGGLIDIIDSFISIAVPLVSFYGDFELSNLLGSLKVWLDKKKLQAQQEELERQNLQNKGWEDLKFNYTF